MSSVDVRDIWSGTTWPWLFLSPLMCYVYRWKVTTNRVDWTHGCCGKDSDTLDLRRVTDMRYKRSLFQLCCCRGTIEIIAKDETTPRLRITTFGLKNVYEELKEAWMDTKSVVVS